MSSVKPVVFITPGAWHTPAYLASYRSALEAHDYPTASLSLPSVSAEPAHQNHDEDTAAIRHELSALIDEQGRDVILVMHSYSGIPASDAAEGLGRTERTAAGRKGGIVLLVYICAYMLPVGESLYTYEGAFGLTAPPAWQRLDAVSNKDKGQIFVIESHHSLYNGLSEGAAEEWTKQLGHQSIGPFTSLTKHAPYEKIGTLYIQCTEDNALLPDRQEKMCKDIGMEKWIKIRTGHSPFLVVPELLSDITRAGAGEDVIIPKDKGITADDIGSAMVSLKVK